jgi:hypothetical protein
MLQSISAVTASASCNQWSYSPQRNHNVTVWLLLPCTLPDWRPDFSQFPKAVLGKPLDGWPGEQWLDVRSPALKPAMLARMKLAVQKGCNGELQQEGRRVMQDWACR